MPASNWVHNNAVVKRAKDLQKRDGAANVKGNQELMTPDGTVVRSRESGKTLRPDIQVCIPPDRVMVSEVYHAQPAKAAKDKILEMQDALGKYCDARSNAYRAN